jgi:hypothetical protein
VSQRLDELLNVRHRFPPAIRQRRWRISRDSGPNDDTTVSVRLPILVSVASNKHSIRRAVRAGYGTCSLHDRMGSAGVSCEYEVVILEGKVVKKSDLEEGKARLPENLLAGRAHNRLGSL